MVCVAKNWQEKPSKFKLFNFLPLSNINWESDFKTASEDCFYLHEEACKDLQ